MVGRGQPLLRLVPALRRSLDQVVTHAAAWDAANARVLAAGPGATPLWVALGDSTAQGVGVADLDDGYVRRVQRLLQARDGRGWDVLNLSRSGALLADVLDRQLPRLVELRQAGWMPALVTCVAGGNDLRRTPLPELLTGVRRLVEALPDDAAVATLPRGLREPRARRANALLIPAATARGLRVVDLWSAVRPPWRGKYADGLHPNAVGTADWVAALATALDLPPEPPLRHPLRRTLPRP